ncbi:hypothetical protein BO443_20152 [Burkholderia orbicola]
MRKAQPRAAAEDHEFGRRVEQHREMLGRERVERRHGPGLDRRAGQHDDARFMAFEIDVDIIGAVAGDGVERAARVLVQFQIGIPRFRRGMDGPGRRGPAGRFRAPGHARTPDGAGPARLWCIAKVGQNPLNYNFLVAPGRHLRRASPQAASDRRFFPV